MGNRAKPILPALQDDDRAFLLARFDRLVDRSGGPDACWPWGGAIKRGYGVTHTSPSGKRRRLVLAHRVAFEVATGDSPPSVDHWCHDNAECDLADDCPHRRCCNPAHLKAATVGENARRAIQGKYGELCRRRLHRMTEENVYVSPDGKTRRCRACQAEAARTDRESAKAERSPGTSRVGTYRKRGMSPAEIVDWALDDQDLRSCCYGPNREPGQGYASLTIGRRTMSAHRLVYEVRVGQIPPGAVVDHTCHDPKTCPGGRTCPHRGCINPDHLMVATNAANTSKDRAVRARPTHCKRGHEFTPENTRVDKRGSRTCKRCTADRAAEANKAAREGVEDARRRKDGKCANGHVIAEVGVNGYGKCKECARERSRTYKARLRGEAA